MDQVKGLKAGTRIKDEWKVEKRIAVGGFSAIYKVSDKKGDYYALKAEGAFAKYQILRMEVLILREARKANPRHFPKMLDKGRMTDFNYIVMTLVGRNLEDLLKHRKSGHFTMGTSIGVAIKTLEALQDLHSVGFIHRDVKPANFAIGREETDTLRSIYILDFGISRKFRRSDGKLHRPRKAAGFRGTGRYASVNCHLLKELGPRDDVESWIYMVIEFTTGVLPWKDMDDASVIGICKQKHHSEPDLGVLVCGCAPGMKKIIRLNDKLTYFDSPPYETFYGLLRASLEATGSKEYPYDWEVEDSYFAQDEQPGELVTPDGTSPKKKHEEDEKSESSQEEEEDGKVEHGKKAKKAKEEEEDIEHGKKAKKAKEEEEDKKAKKANEVKKKKKKPSAEADEEPKQEEDTYLWDKPCKKGGIDDMPGKETGAEEKPAKETAAEEKPAKEAGADDKAGKKFVFPPPPKKPFVFPPAPKKPFVFPPAPKKPFVFPPAPKKSPPKEFKFPPLPKK